MLKLQGFNPSLTILCISILHHLMYKTFLRIVTISKSLYDPQQVWVLYSCLDWLLVVTSWKSLHSVVVEAVGLCLSSSLPSVLLTLWLHLSDWDIFYLQVMTFLSLFWTYTRDICGSTHFHTPISYACYSYYYADTKFFLLQSLWHCADELRAYQDKRVRSETPTAKWMKYGMESERVYWWLTLWFSTYLYNYILCPQGHTLTPKITPTQRWST